jgi:FkbM family methyltransferase
VNPVQLFEYDEGGRAWVDLRDGEVRAAYLHERFWPEIHPIVGAFLGGGGDFFDVGANFGLVTFALPPLVAGRGTRFHLFEANPRLVPLLRRSAELWPGESFRVVEGCVGDRAGTSRLAVPSRTWGQAAIADHGVEVPNVVLDDYIAEQGVERIGFLKMDLNGWEGRALRGAWRALAAGRVEAAFVEVIPADLLAAGESAEGLMGTMEGLGFDAYFCGLSDISHPAGVSWGRAVVHGTALRIAAARPLPAGYVRGDVTFVHRSAPVAAAIRAALTGGS